MFEEPTHKNLLVDQLMSDGRNVSEAEKVRATSSNTLRTDSTPSLVETEKNLRQWKE